VHTHLSPARTYIRTGSLGVPPRLINDAQMMKMNRFCSEPLCSSLCFIYPRCCYYCALAFLCCLCTKAALLSQLYIHQPSRSARCITPTDRALWSIWTGITALTIWELCGIESFFRVKMNLPKWVDESWNRILLQYKKFQRIHINKILFYIVWKVG
jgi:hypothetical protein